MAIPFPLRVRGETGIFTKTPDDLKGSGSILVRPFTKVAAFVKMETGSYTGDGAISKVVSLTDPSLRIQYVKVWQRHTTAGTAIETFETTADILDDHASKMSIRESGSLLSAAAQIQVASDGIIAISTGSCTVDDAGTDAHPNANTVVYNYLVLGT